MLRMLIYIVALWAILSRSAIAGDGPLKPFALALHGGAGIDPAKLTAAETRAYEDSLRRALEVGRKILANGGSALDCVEETIRALEDDPLFNAGKGAVLNHERQHELDASIMDGKSRQAGAVAGVTTVKNPISLARLVMTETPHVLLAGPGAEKFADEMRGREKISRVENSYFTTDKARRELDKALEKEAQGQLHKGTVGCVALDRHGNLTAGTSTGGLTNKKFGRVGDSPIIGAGTYADNATCAVSCTGTGEHFIRNSAAFHVAALMTYKELPLDASVRTVIHKVLKADTGGMIALDGRGNIAMHCNTTGMARASLDPSGKVEILLGPSAR